MSLRQRFLVIVSLACVIAASSASAGGRAHAVGAPPLTGHFPVLVISSAGAGGDRQPFKISSTLDGKRVLPLRMRWLAYPKLPAKKISKVEFLIDGKVRWIEHKSPYNYGSDDFHGHLGYLITTWLKAGRHTFTARAVDRLGRSATDTVTARVLPAPEPPADLAGTWSRTVTPDDIKKSGPMPPPSGRWKLIFDRVGAWHIDPDNGGVVNQYSARPDVIDVFAPITMAPKGIGRFGAHGFGCCDCRGDGPFGSYNWSVSGNELTLKARHEGCPNRRAIWEGVWTRIRGG
jgi:hypothetical protein